MTLVSFRSGLQAVARRGTVLRSALPMPSSAASAANDSNATMTKRWYRGDSGEMETTLSAKEQELLSVAQPRADAIYERHVMRRLAATHKKLTASVADGNNSG